MNRVFFALRAELLQAWEDSEASDSRINVFVKLEGEWFSQRTGEQFLLEAASWGLRLSGDLEEEEASAVGRRYQTTGEDISNLGDLHACCSELQRVCELATALQLIVVTRPV
jgi:hypothetical protein